MKQDRSEFHIRADDFFGTLATVLDLTRQDIEKRGAREEHTRMLTRKVKELVLLQRNFRIVERVSLMLDRCH